jgi:phytoene dehydrogenase-like protein
VAHRTELGGYLSAQGLSQDAIELVILGFSPTLSASQLLLVEASLEVRNAFYHIRGGNHLLPAALARRPAGKIHYGCRIHAFTQDGSQASLVVERETRQQLEERRQ